MEQKLYKTRKYDHFMEYFEQEDCPLCTMGKQWVREFNDAFLYESVNDRSIRKKIMDNGGFCSRHAHAMMEHGDPLAHAIIYSSLIEDYLEKPDRKKKPGCVVCDLEADAQTVMLKAFLEYFEKDEAFANRFLETKSCLCRPHLKALKGVTKNKALFARLYAIQEQNLKNARVCLEEIKRKHDYRYNREALTEEEKTAWKRAVKLMAGDL